MPLRYFQREVSPVDIRLVRFYSSSYRKTKGESEMTGKLMSAFRSLLYKSPVERELDEELRFHIEQHIEQNIRLGMSMEEARDEALRAFGGVEQAKERSRDIRGGRWLEELWQDLRFGVRM